MNDATDGAPLCLTAEEAAAFIGVSTSTIENQYRIRALRGVLIGRHLRFRRCDLIRFCEELEVANET